MPVKVTFFRCFAEGLHSPIVNVSGNNFSEHCKQAGPYRIPALDQTCGIKARCRPSAPERQRGAITSDCE
jgi:hypothetical protein